MKLIKIFLGTLALGFGSLSAHASLLSIVGGNVMNIQTNAPFANNFANVLPANQTYTVGGNLKANVNLAVEYFYLGHEAAFNNHFVVGNLVIDTSSQSPFLKCINNVCDSTIPKNNLQLPYVAPTINSNATAGSWLNFAFWTQTHWNQTDSVINGFNTANQAKYDFSVALNTKFHNTFYDAILFLDDTGTIFYNNHPVDDNDHDDMLIGVRVFDVSEPSGLLLTCLGMFGLFLIRRIKH
jgi:hypothetical protein